MDEPQRERDPESYFGAGIGGGRGLFTAGGTSDGPHSPAPAAPSVATTGLVFRELDVKELRKELRRQGVFLHEP